MYFLDWRTSPTYETILEIAINQYNNLHPDEQVTSHDDIVIQTDVIPSFAKWLFNDWYQQFSGEVDLAIIHKFVDEFMYRYLNMETCHKSPAVFKSKLYYGLNKYTSYLLQASDEYEHLNNANLSITSSSETNSTREGSTNTKFDGKETGSNTGSASNESHGGTSGTNTQTVGQTTSGDSSSKSANSDYPQSMVDLTVTSPQSLDWRYASDSNESVNSNTGKTDTNVDAETKSTANSNSSSQESSTQNITRDDTTSGTTNETMSSTTTNSVDVISQFDRIMKLLDYLDSHRYPAIYYVIEQLDIYFISQFVDEDREGYIDPATCMPSMLLTKNS